MASKRRNEEAYAEIRDRTSSDRYNDGGEWRKLGTGAPKEEKPRKVLTAAELAASVQRMHDARVAERSKKKAELEAAAPSLPVLADEEKHLGAAAPVAGGVASASEKGVARSAKGGIVGASSSAARVRGSVGGGASVTPEDLHRTFVRFDTNADGYIDAHELRSALNALGVPTTDLNRAEAILSEYDADGNRSLDEGEFGALLGSVQAFLREVEERDERRRRARQQQRARSAGELRVGDGRGFAGGGGGRGGGASKGVASSYLRRWPCTRRGRRRSPLVS